VYRLLSTIYKNGLMQIYNIKRELEEWMAIKNYTSIEESEVSFLITVLKLIRLIYKRAQYVDLLINSEKISPEPEFIQSL